MRDLWRQQYVDEHLRPTDVITNTLPKCGQTMLQALLFAIKRRGNVALHDQTLINVSPWIEVAYPKVMPDGTLALPTHEMQIMELEECDDPRVFKQHVPWSEVARSTDAKIQQSIKYITITRDIRDVPFSLYMHMQAHSESFFEAIKPPPGVPAMALPKDFTEFFEFWLNIMNPFEFLVEMWEHRNDSDLLMLKYEEVSKNKLHAAKTIIKFLGWEPLSDEVLERDILPKCTFEYMREHEKTIVGDKVWKPDTHFIRQGKIGKNRELLSDDQLMRLRHACEEKLPKRLVDYLYRD